MCSLQRDSLAGETNMTDTFLANASIVLLASEPLVRTILHETLERAGYVVVAVDGVGAAVDRLKQMRPDLLIVRPYVNSMTGHMAAHYLRTWTPGLPVLIVDGFLDDERIHDHNALKDFHIFPKPFARDELLDKVKDVLRIAHEKER
jgi:DNA-binding NtrC family response regulator